MTTPSFNHVAVHATVRISIKSDTRLSVGTGFFYLAEDRLLLISNKHVLKEGKGTMTLALKQIDGTLQTFIFEDFRKLYFGHPDNSVDLASVNVSVILASNAYVSIRPIGKNFLTPIDYKKVALGSDVLFVGYPNDYYDTYNNLPLVRKGTLASLPHIDFMGKGQIVIDAQVFGGSSGSPVFVDWDGQYRLLGVISNTLVARTSESGASTMLGLGIVIKQRHVQELIDSAVRI